MTQRRFDLAQPIFIVCGRRKGVGPSRPDQNAGCPRAFPCSNFESAQWPWIRVLTEMSHLVITKCWNVWRWPRRRCVTKANWPF